MKFILKTLLSAVAVVILANILPGVQVSSFLTAIWVALIISVLNVVVKPILVILTFPITVITLGLFLLIINACIILLTDWLLNGFSVATIWYALLFSLLLSIIQSILYKLIDEKKQV